MQVTAVLSNKGELEMGAVLNNLAVAVGIVFVLLIASLKAEVAKAGGKGEEAQSRCARAAQRLCCGAADGSAKVEAEVEVAEVVVDAEVWAERLKVAIATSARRLLAVKASARAAAAAAGAARHAAQRTARANGAAWPAAAATARAASAVAQRAAGAAMKSARDAELDVSASAAMRGMLGLGEDGRRARLGDTTQEHRIGRLAPHERAVELAGVHQSWVAAFGGKLEPRGGKPLQAASAVALAPLLTAAAAAGHAVGWQPRTALPALRPSAACTSLQEL
jgi:hypothetical protein